MKKTTVIDRQSWFDIALQEYGSAAIAFQLATINGAMITEELMPGQKVLLPSLPGDRDIGQFYQNKNIRPATATPSLLIEKAENWFGGLPGMLPLMLS